MKTNLWIVLIIFFLAPIVLDAQANFHRTYIQNPVPAPGVYFNCNMAVPVKTADKGYVFSFNAWSPGLHNYNALDYYLFKTDSNFVPQWKKSYSTKAIPLPTGGIILYWSVNFIGMSGPQYSIIEKVTASGQQVWCKIINSDTRLNEGVQYNDKIRLVGGVIGIISMIPFTQYSYQPYTIEMDTLGNVTSQQVFSHPLGSQTDFKGIKRDVAGNFYLLGGLYYMVLAKFSPSFVPIWAKYHPQYNQQLYLIDEDFLPNGEIFCTAQRSGIGAQLMRLDSMGNIIDQKHFPNTKGISGLCKLPNGNYSISLCKGQDSLCLFEASTSFSITNFRYAGKGVSIGTPLRNNNTLYFMRFIKDPVLLRNDNNLSNCVPPAPFTMLSSTVQLSSFLLTPSIYTSSVSNYTYNNILPQIFVDSCKCAAGVTGNINACSTVQNTLSLLSYGPMNWYNVSNGGAPISTGPNLLFSYPNPGTYTLFVEDSSCISMGRLPVTVTVQGLPLIAINSSNGGACGGSAVTLTAQGATSYTWNNGQQGPVLNTNLLSSNTSYSVNGKGSNGCPGTQTALILVYPNPTLNISASATSICMSQTTILNASGAISYIWNNNFVDSSIVVSPVNSQAFTVTGLSSQGCVGSQTINIIVNTNPTVNVSGSSNTICIGETTTLMATGAQNYSWNTGQIGSTISISPQQSYYYLVTGVDFTGCYSQTGYWVYLDLCTNLTEEFSQTSISLYPNPSQDLFYIRAPENIKFTLCLYTLQGQLLLSAPFKNGESLDLGAYPKGVYCAQIKEDSKLTTVKIVKQ